MLLLAMMGVPGLAVSASTPEAPIEILFQWSLSIDSTGKIVSLVPVDDDYQRTLREQLEPVIHRWHFTPGKLNGQPAATETTVAVNVTLDPVGEDYRVRIVAAKTGGTYKHVVAPEYPKPAIRMGRHGEVSLRVDYDADGHITSVAPTEDKDAPWVDGSLKRAAVAAVKQWTMTPEMVAGRGVAGAVIEPFCFSLAKEGERSDNDDQCRHTPLHARRLGVARPIALTSVVGIDMGTADHVP